MARWIRLATTLTIGLPVVGLVVAIVLAWNDAVGPLDVALLVGGYFATGLGVTVGFHRLLTHGSFRTRPWVRHALAVLGTMAAQGPVISWVADHRKHHAHSDERGDPHSPHLDREGETGGLRGLWHAHVGWLFDWRAKASPRRYAKDLNADPVMKWINAHFLHIVIAGVIAPFVIGFAVRGSLMGGLQAFVWGGLVRVFVVHHVTWSINSVAHSHGRRRWQTSDRSVNVAWLAPFTFGESWHNNHHAFPAAAVHGMGRWQLDLGGLCIRGLALVGLAWDLVSPKASRIESKALDPAA
jgi:stearoyl-CoA desaturase (delta-9 desaturase)